MSSKLLIADIGSYEQLCRNARQCDIEALQGIASMHRKCESLAWRALLYAELGRQVDIGYTESGAPYIVGDEKTYIGVSHCRDRVAVIVGDAPCSVDIERRDRNFRRAASKFIREEEQWIVDLGDDALAVAWSAKEAAYKYCQGGIALSDVHIRSIDFGDGVIEYDIAGKNIGLMHFRLEKEHIVVTIG